MKVSAVHGEVRAPGTLLEGAEFDLDAVAAAALLFREVNAKEAFTVVDATGAYFRATLRSLSPERGRALAYEKMAASPESPVELTLLCPVLGRQRMIQVTQKATELGVTRLVPVLTDKSVPRAALEHEKPWAWPGQAKKASRQCRRAIVPEVWPATSLKDALASEPVEEAPARFVLDDRADASSARAPFAEEPVAKLVLLTGPEGGFTDRERRAIAERGFSSLVLGTRVLRAETAVLVGLTLLQYAYGDLRP